MAGVFTFGEIASRGRGHLRLGSKSCVVSSSWARSRKRSLLPLETPVSLGADVSSLAVPRAVAQWLEQGTHNPSVVGSIPTGPTRRAVSRLSISTRPTGVGVCIVARQ